MSPTLRPIIRAEGLTKEYVAGGQRIRALDAVSLNVQAGEMLAVMGPSGSGKSTLLHLLGCLDRPSAGRYQFLSEEVGRLSDDALTRLRRRHIGFVFQNSNLLPRATPLDNVALPLVYAGISSEESGRKGRLALERVGLGHRISQPSSTLSGGEQQRVAIARGLVAEPALILADEPTGALDSRTGQGILELLASLNGAGITVLVVTHDPAVAGYAPRLVQMLDGRLASDGPSISRPPAQPDARPRLVGGWGGQP